MSVLETHEIRVRGTVQGVGFRPTVFRLASEESLVGEVFNDSEGVLIRISGCPGKLSNFVHQLNVESPPLAKIDAIESIALKEFIKFPDFRINDSAQGNVSTEVSSDAATCSACLEELFNPSEHRYRYPFINCTHCGPRISIVKRIPYDRENSTMAPFAMCQYCLNEYQNPLDRRFHAQPIACFDCGPQIKIAYINDEDVQLESLSAEFTALRNVQLERDLTSNKNSKQTSKHSITESILHQVDSALHEGMVVAIRGLGGFHLCCDASNHDAVKALRFRKQRYAKPFALMTHSLKLVESYCHVSSVEREQLTSNVAPIVLLDRLSDAAQKGSSKKSDTSTHHERPTLSVDIAPGSNLYGFMMPYTPLHWLIAERFGKPLVMTSGNLSKQPQIIDNQEAIEKLKGIADIVLYHDREIANRIDDSVVRFMAGEARVMRRARGFAPRSFMLPEGFEQSSDILACGAELKSTFCLVKDGKAMVSQHQGDLEDLSTFDDYAKNLELYRQLYEVEFKTIAVDLHPEYMSSKYATNELILEHHSKCIDVQHHHAHIASCLVENEVPLATPEVLGIALDGLGYGSDDTLWGGEFLLADYTSFKRIGRFKPIAMLGGAQAIKEPWRNTYAQIMNAMTWKDFIKTYSDVDLCTFLKSKPIDLLEKMLSEGINSPHASSCGRLFDAVAAAVGLCRETAQYEGQGAIELEMQVDGFNHYCTDMHSFNAYSITVEHQEDFSKLIEIDPAPMWPELLRDLQEKTDLSVISERFHRGLINAIFSTIEILCERHSITTVAMSGGCLQNKVILEGLTMKAQQAGLTCLSQRYFPANDGGISLGQAAIAAAKLIK